jgi:hypothetical protein
MIEKATDMFKGKNGEKRINCAQAIAAVCNMKYPGDEELIAVFKSFGGGKAPNNWCGAYYAARHLLEKHDPSKIDDLSRAFEEKAGDLSCKKIRKLKKLSCEGCVAAAASFCSDVTRNHE